MGQPDPNGKISLALLRGDADAAMHIALQTPADKRDPYTALAAQVGPDRAAADSALAKVVANTPVTKANSYRVAQIYAVRGDVDNTMEWLERTWNMPKGVSLVRQSLLYDPLVLRFRKEPRFIAFCKKIGLPPPSESEALSIDQIHALQKGKT